MLRRWRRAAGPVLAELEKQIAAAEKAAPQGAGRSTASTAASQKARRRRSGCRWISGEASALDRVVLAGVWDDFNGIGAGFGFPVRFQIEGSDDPDFEGRPDGDRRARSRGLRESRHCAAELRREGKERAVCAGHRDEARAAQGRLHLRARGAAGLRHRGEKRGARRARHRATASKRPSAGRAKISPTASILPQPAAGERLARTAGETRCARWPVPRLAGKPCRPRGQRRGAGTDRPGACAACRRTQLVFRRHRPHRHRELSRHWRDGWKAAPDLLARPRPSHDAGRRDAPGCVEGARATCVPEHFETAGSGPEGERRAALAKWITDPANPLTWRSIVNRVWQFHFGRGLADTPNDFGRMGVPPTHPELLDWLAVRFRDEMGGSLESTAQAIVMSATYRQSSTTKNERAAAIDSGNTLLWRANRAQTRSRGGARCRPRRERQTRPHDGRPGLAGLRGRASRALAALRIRAGRIPRTRRRGGARSTASSCARSRSRS